MEDFFMDLKMNYNSFIKLKDFFKVVDVSAEVDEYSVKNDSIDGSLSLRGKYLKRDNQTTEYFLEKVPFTIAMTQGDFEVEDIDCVDLEYVGFDGRGIDVTFDILVNYYIYEEIPVLQDDISEVSTRLETDELPLDAFEELKNIETTRVDELLMATLSFKDDNLPTQEVVIRGLNDTKSSIRVCYYKDDKDLEQISVKNNVSIDTIFKTNQKYEMNKYHRVILNDKQ